MTAAARAKAESPRDTFDRVTAGWSDDQKQALMARLHREATRARISREYNSAGKLAQYLDPSTVQTPALERIDQAIEWALNTRRARLIITVPPQEGKTTRVGVITPLRALQKEPDWRIVLVSYAEALAKEASRLARNLIVEHGSNATDAITGLRVQDKLGLALSPDSRAAGKWRVQGHKGGMYVAGIEGGVTGRPADMVIIDDPFKGMKEADSKAEREAVIEFWQAIALTRLAPAAPVIIIQTRWHENDLAGYLLAQDKRKPEEEREWVHVNIPAIADGVVPDALQRPAGEYLESARGRTRKDWDLTREAVGPRVWSALYQGVPTPVGGGLFSSDDFDRYRLQAAGDTTIRIVSVDPAETGKRDEAGLIGVAATPDNRVLWTHDWSGRMTSDQWSRKAVILALTIGAAEISYEAYTTEQTYRRVLIQAWRSIRNQARLLRAAAGNVEIAAAVLAGSEDAPADPLAAIREVDGVPVPDVTDPPFTIHPFRGKGDKTVRATGSRQAVSTGRLRVVGTLLELESQAVTWQLGQKSPDRMDAAVNGYERIIQLIGGQSLVVTPAEVMAQQATGAPAASSGLASILAQPLNMSDRA